MTTPPTLSLPARLCVETLSDWHIGTGAGVPGGVDRAVARDSDGLPFISTASLTGVLSTSAAAVALALDDGVPGGLWSKWHSWLFGGLDQRGERAPSPAAISMSPARFSPEVRRALVAEGLTMDTTFERSSTAIDSDSGVAVDKTLRVIEFARKGARLEATVEASGELGDLPAEAAFLLAAATRRCERFGGKRTRGPGRCSITLDPSPDWAEWCEWAAEHEPEAPPSVQSASDDQAEPFDPPHGTAWEAVELELVVVEPLAVEAERRGNTLTTQLRVPGTSLLPAVHERLGPHLGAAIARGDLQVSDALPLDPSGRRTIPTPAGWLVAKETTSDPSPLTDTLIDEPPPGVQLRRVAAPFVVVDDQGVAHEVDVETVIDAHAVIDGQAGRPTASTGGLFLRQAIRQGERFGFSVRWRQGLCNLDDARSALCGRWRVGTARHGGYGTVEVRATPDPPAPSPRHATVPVSNQTVMVEARSDVLVRNNRLRWDPTPRGIARALSVAGWEFEPASSGPGADTAVLTVSRRDGWHAGWSLPRPTLGAIGAGSRLVLRCVSTGQPDSLTDLLERGVGERLGEGFGDLRLTAVSTSARELESNPGSPSPPQSETAPASRSDDPFVVTVRRARTRRDVQLALETVQLRGLSPGKPGPSQLGALRSVAVGLALEAGPAALERAVNWFAALRATQGRAERWQHETLDDIESLLGTPSIVWGRLGVVEQPDLTYETLGWYLAAAARNGVD